MMQNIIQGNCPRQKDEYKVFCYMVAAGKASKKRPVKQKREGFRLPETISDPTSFILHLRGKAATKMEARVDEGTDQSRRG